MKLVTICGKIEFSLKLLYARYNDPVIYKSQFNPEKCKIKTIIEEINFFWLMRLACTKSVFALSGVMQTELKALQFDSHHEFLN